MKKILFIHGFGGNQNSYFFPYLKEELSTFGEIFSPNFPDSENPGLEKRENYFLKNNKNNYDTVICHSLGGLFALNLISRGVLKTKNLVNIGSPFGIRKKQSINTFLEKFNSTEEIIKNTEKIIISHSFDDPWVDHEFGIISVKNLKADGYFYSDKGHFETSKLPDNLVREIKNLLK